MREIEPVKENTIGSAGGNTQVTVDKNLRDDNLLILPLDDDETRVLHLQVDVEIDCKDSHAESKMPEQVLASLEIKRNWLLLRVEHVPEVLSSDS
jgi:hypothetical protein